MLDWSENTGRIAIGWGKVGDIRTMGYASRRDVSLAIRQRYSILSDSGADGACLYEFCFGMKPGDLVILSREYARSLVMRIDDAYEYVYRQDRLPAADYHHQRAASVAPIHADALWRMAGDAPAPGHSLRWPLIQCRRPVDSASLSEVDTPQFAAVRVRI